MRYKNVIKPFFDYSFAILFGVFLLPIFVLIYFLLRLTYRVDPIFKQPRPGKEEKIFEILKFKTMTDAMDDEGKLLPDKDRTTAFGNILRKTSLDEIPQLINVLKGDMSFVGPRPLRVRYLPYYTSREQLRHTVKPGITGLAQVSGRNAITWNKRLELDAVYVENLSLKNDISILIRTAIKVFDFSATDFSSESDNLDEHRKFIKNSTYKI